MGIITLWITTLTRIIYLIILIYAEYDVAAGVLFIRLAAMADRSQCVAALDGGHTEFFSTVRAIPTNPDDAATAGRIVVPKSASNARG